ncbi:unnamed protein product [Symbiodinium sp. KB8]|nr:unnamed protein product [Symbiodinium sp. KB8]
MIDGCCHAPPSLLLAEWRPGVCRGLVFHGPGWKLRGKPTGRPALSRLAAFGACGGLLVGMFLRVPRRRVVRRLARDQKDVSAKEQSMLDRLRDHAVALGGKCLAIEYKNTYTKVPWQCQHGHTWDARPHNVLYQKSWCPECARNRQRIPLKRLQDHARVRGGRCLSESTYNRSGDKVMWECKLGHTWKATPSMVLSKGSWCPKCSRKGRTYKRRSLKDLQEHAASLGGGCLTTTYAGVMVPVLWQCREGHIWSASANNIFHNKSWCPVCSGRAPLELARLQEHARRRGGECLATEYVNNKSKVPWKCQHGHTWQARPDNVLNLGQWCPHCRKIGLARLRGHAASLGGRCLARSYKTAREKLLWECKDGHRWKASASQVLHRGSWCPQCAASIWRTEAEVRSTLETIFHPAKFPSSYPPFLDNLQLDGYCPNLSLAFEYKGEQHYDPQNYFHFGDPSSFHAQQERDARKVCLCKDAGVRLLIIPCFVNDKRTFVLTALLQWFSWAQLTPPELPVVQSSPSTTAAGARYDLPLLFLAIGTKLPLGCMAAVDIEVASISDSVAAPPSRPMQS